jgi:DnaK suppressor protein
MATLTNTATWPAAKHAALQRLLRAQREVLREQKRSLREALPWETVAVADDEERAAQEFDVGLDIRLLEMRAREVQDIEAAVQLLESGDYGRCVDCGEPIHPSRLQAHPSALRCCSCQQVFEQNDSGPAAPASRPFWEGPAPPTWPRAVAVEGGRGPEKKRGPVAVPVAAPVGANARPARRSERKSNGFLTGL